MKKMRKSASNVNNAVNLISGAYTLPLIDKLFSNSQRIENMDDVYFAITACILRSLADSDAFQSGRCAEHNGRPETLAIIN